MIKRIQLSVWIILLVGLSGCIFQNDEFFGEFTTDLRVTVKDVNTRDRLPDANVVLFRSKTDFEARSSIEASGKTNKNGTVWFSGLQDVNYYIYVSYEKDGMLYDNSTADFNMGQELVDGALTEVELVVRPKRSLEPTKVDVESLWLMDYESNLDSTRRLGMLFFLYDSLTDEYYDLGRTGFYRYRTKNPVSEETHARELPEEDFMFDLENSPILYVLTGEIVRQGRNQYDTIYISYDSVSFARYHNRDFYPERIRLAEWDDIILDLKVNWN